VAAVSEQELARLESSTPFEAGMTDLLGFPVRYTHPQSMAVQYRAIFGDDVYRFRASRPDPVILDCGANIGMASLYWKREYPAARITAFEPDPTIAEVMRWNLRSAAAEDVTVVGAAVWNAATSLHFIQQGAGGGRLGEGSLEVRTVRLRDYLDDPVDFLKLDIEGAEVDVLLDCADVLDRVEYLFVEYHSFRDRPQRFDALVSVLAQAGYRLAVQTEYCPRSPFVDESAHPDFDLQLNISAIRR
jgi:FkbM family methyltransferase